MSTLKTDAKWGSGARWLAYLAGPALVAVLWVSVLSRGADGEMEWPLTLENYKRVAGFGLFGFDPLYPVILGRSLAMAGATAGLCVLLGMPVAFWLAGLGPRWKTVGLVAVVIPFWTNLLVRTYAWQILLGPEGLATRMVGASEGLYPSGAAVLVCLVCDYLPFAVLPIYAAVERLNWELPEAARDLGARGLAVFRNGILPQIRAGIWTAGALVFLPAIGQFVVPDLLGGAKTFLLGNLLQQQFGASRDWPFGSAIATVTMAVVFAGLWMEARFARRRA